ncbi:LCI fold-containing protein [Bacillus thuringiensis]|uniref:LCI fold-containing protein n=1 Tax=Bacillus cereus group TaxID=86661 RepID=UPI000995C548|nr:MULTISPECIES: LCI fold-containing protein [Bacillus cereus group]MDA1870364.1 LCI family antimicrobial peptide [Bacillus cereus]OPA04716.1 hypothetical protein BHL54_28795 [Bacillus cereus]
MFKKLVVGAVATGIALTGGIGAASADTQNPKQATCSIPYEYSNGKFKRTLYYSNGVYANSFNENVCGGTITWYLKHVQNGVAFYEGNLK